jgi:hypothetical protein
MAFVEFAFLDYMRKIRGRGSPFRQSRRHADRQAGPRIPFPWRHFPVSDFPVIHFVYNPEGSPAIVGSGR